MGFFQGSHSGEPELSLKLNHRQCTAGGLLRGEVILRPLQRRCCQGVTLALIWFTRGRGFLNQDRPVQLELEAPPVLEAGQYYSVPFQLQLPCGPFSYKGEMFQVHWQIQARLKTKQPFFAPTFHQSFSLEPAPKQPKIEGPQAKPLGILFGRDRAAMQPWLTTGLVFMGISLGMTMLMHFEGEAQMWPITIPCAIAGLTFLGLAFENILAQFFLGRIRVKGPVLPRAGEPVHCEIAFKPRFKLRLQNIKFELASEERCRYNTSAGSREGKRYNLIRRQKTFNTSQTITTDQSNIDRRSKTYRASFELPEIAAPTFLGNDNQYLWKIEVSIQPSNLPRWRHSIFFQVLP